MLRSILRKQFRFLFFSYLAYFDDKINFYFFFNQKVVYYTQREIYIAIATNTNNTNNFSRDY